MSNWFASRCRHRPNRAEEHLDEQQADYEAVPHQSRESHERTYDQAYISDLTKRLEAAWLEAASKSLLQFHLYGHMKLNYDAQSVLYANSMTPSPARELGPTSHKMRQHRLPRRISPAHQQPLRPWSSVGRARILRQTQVTQQCCGKGGADVCLHDKRYLTSKLENITYVEDVKKY
jgi:hypothetical protein